MRPTSCTAAAVLPFLIASHAAADVQLWRNPVAPGFGWAGPSAQIGGAYGEVADDFTATAAVNRIIVRGAGTGCFICPPPEVTGAYVRFYEWTPLGPGELQQEQFVAADDPALRFDVSYPEAVSVQLPEPFFATGQHFVSVQLVITDHPSYAEGWYVLQSHTGEPVGSPLLFRNNPLGGWGATPEGPVNADMAFELYGTPPGGDPPSQDPCGDWEPVPTPDGPAGAARSILTDLTVVAPDDVWAVGVYTLDVGLSYEDFPYVLRWDGAQWNEAPVPSPECSGCLEPALIAVAAAGPDDIWAGGRVERPFGGPWYGNRVWVVRTDGSGNWQEVPLPELGTGAGGAVVDIEVVSPDFIWMCGTPPPPGNAPQPGLIMRWNGSSLQRIDFPLVNPFLSVRDGGNPINDIHAAGPDLAWAVGGTSVYLIGEGAEYSQIHRWDGSQWTHVPGPTPGVYNELWTVEIAAPNDVWAAGEYWAGSGGIFPLLLRWDGSSWSEVPSPGFIRDFHAVAPDDVYAVGEAVFHWDGSAWRTVETFPGNPYAGMSDIEPVGPCSFWTVGRQVGAVHETFSARLSAGGACAADWDGDDTVTSTDISSFLTSWLASLTGGTLQADYNADGAVNSADISAFLAAWLAAVQVGC